MYIYYVLRGTRGGKPVELEGDIDEEGLPGINLNDGPAIIDFLVHKLTLSRLKHKRFLFHLQRF